MMMWTVVTLAFELDVCSWTCPDCSFSPVSRISSALAKAMQLYPLEKKGTQKVVLLRWEW